MSAAIITVSLNWFHINKHFGLDSGSNPITFP